LSAIGDDALSAEPFRIKAVEMIRTTTRAERQSILDNAGHNPFLIRSEDVFIDLLTDSGTGAMSDRQWGALMVGDEAYAGARSFYKMRDAVERVMGFPFVLPTHQGRGAENILFTVLVKPGQYVLNNTHFDTTAAHVRHKGGLPVDLAVPAAYDTQTPGPFKGDMDVAALERFIAEKGRESIALIMSTVTSNGAGGQPVALENLRLTSQVARRHGIPFYIDACRFAENAYFIKRREAGQGDRAILDIARDMMSTCDGCTMSAKKDGLANIGGFLATRDEAAYKAAVQWGVLFEGFPTYGGMAGRDMEAVAQGLAEVVDESYLAQRTGQVAHLGAALRRAGVPIVEPPGGHAVYIDVLRFLDHMPREAFPAWALTCELYLEAGVRAVEIGGVMAGRDDKGQNAFSRLELVRLAIPRRTYTDRHLDVVAAALGAIAARRRDVRGVRFTYEPPFLRHFTARFAPLL
jgi:tryptophanase